MPHFEKMLYDQGQLLRSYTDAYLATKESCYAEIIDDIVTYVTRDLRHQVIILFIPVKFDELDDFIFRLIDF